MISVVGTGGITAISGTLLIRKREGTHVLASTFNSSLNLIRTDTNMAGGSTRVWCSYFSLCSLKRTCRRTMGSYCGKDHVRGDMT